MELQEVVDRIDDRLTTTPSNRLNYDLASLSKSDKERIIKADPNGGRCLLTNSNLCSNFCHCIPKFTMKNDDVMDSLEWFWNMKRHTLNLNTHKNVFLAKNDFHHLFDQRKWLLVPEKDILDKFSKSLISFFGRPLADRKDFPEISGKTFFYKFVPLGDMEEKNLKIMRDDDDGTYTIHTYPQNTLPLLESHIHPKFVIFNAGSKLNKLFEQAEKRKIEKVSENHPDIDLKAVMALYVAWTRPIPAHALEDTTYVIPKSIIVRKYEVGDGGGNSSSDGGGGGGDADDGDFVCHDYGDELRHHPRTRSAAKQDANNNASESRTESGRGDGLCIRLEAEQDSAGPMRAPAKKGGDHRLGMGPGQKGPGQKASAAKMKANAIKKRKVFSESSAHNHQFLSEATLTSFNQHFGVGGWTGDCIRRWSSSTTTKKRKVFQHLPP